MDLPILRLALISALVFSVACGARDTGDDGGGGGSGAPLANITQGGAVAMGAAVVRATFLSGDMPDVIDAAIPPDLGPLLPSTQIPGRDIPNFETRAPFGPNNVNCNVAGDVDLQGDVADTMTYTQGDQVESDFNGCNNGFGYTYDGILDFTVSQLTGDLLSANFDVTLDATMSNLLVDDGFGTLLCNGDATSMFDTTGDPVFDMSLSGNSLTLNEAGSTYTLTNYDSDLTIDTTGTDTYVFGSQGRMTSNAFTGEVIISTPTDFQGNVGSPPDSGQMRVDGANSTMWIDPVDSTDVELNLDLDGNGTVDALVDTTWVALGL